MNIEELQGILKSKKIDITAREISSIWNMNEQSFSKKKKAGSAIKAKNNFFNSVKHAGRIPSGI